jgi:hypothetical protein
VRDDGVIVGRDGRPLSRVRSSGNYHNEFDIPQHLWPEGWSPQWVTTSVHGKDTPANVNAHYANGWRPASPKNWPFVMPDQKNSDTIEREGQILMERPNRLNEEALAELHSDAVELREIQTESFGTRKLPKGFDKGTKDAKGRFDARKKVNRRLEGAPKETRPAYEYAGADEE